ncbi:hypothetical protein PRZ48_005347 [Zasmidium cellare]|uniref:AMP-dependent synthetase/ligase domain-containing protein n=1 Tax=Zasmidium cellare TaxID=395010 RepID=A0ABR0ETA4_ZASCE|nr:hypothetical protein PRZ48_005347 [Zasmidium cellare]
MLATTSLGAIWTALSPDTGITAMVDRLSQIEPKILFTDDVATYNAKTHSVLPKVREATRQISALRAMVILSAKPESESASSPASALLEMTYSEFLAGGRESHELSFEQFPAEHPVYILYSSGTTGKPKCIVHGAIGTLLQHKKEHILQSDIKPGDRLFFFTTCMWMMWHWHVSALASGITLVLYDGSPFYYRREGYTEAVEDYQAMPKLIDELQITHFGTSAKYLSVLQQKAVRPKESGLCLKSLKAIYSTGSPLAPTTFEYVYDIFGSSIQLGSISGGTDIIADFGVPCPIEPVHSGEIQVPALGMAVQAWSQEGVDVCFWGASGFDNYKAAYFQRFPGVWHHGDFIRFNEATGGIYMLGRSDGTLNPSGVRFGSAEIYNVLLSNFADCVADSLCVGQRRENETDETVVLFVKMLDERRLTSELVQTIKKTVWDQLSPRHVPRHVVECPEIPYTHNNKKVELAVKRIISGTKVTSTAGIANGHCLAWYQDWASTKLDEEHI